MIYQNLLITTSLVIATVLGANAQAAGSGNNWQLKQLHSPSEGLAKAERGGRVTIYDGIHGPEIDRAMDEQFDRIDYMMFIHPIEETPGGEQLASDDDC